MCGRINTSDHEGVQSLLRHLGINLDKLSFTPRYNVAPGADVLVAFQSTRPDVAVMRWGILPAWAKNKPGSRPLINARIETAWDKPSFKKLIASSRAIIPVNGFYEWYRDGKQKTPFYISDARAPAMALGAIYQITGDGTMEVAILTREATGDMATIHHRMPITLSPEHMAAWLVAGDEAETRALLGKEPDPPLELRKVSSYVNNAANEGSRCTEAVAA